MSKQFDERLIQKVIDGEFGAFEEVVKTLKPFYRGILHKYIYDKAMHEDIEQELMMKTYEVIYNYDSSRNVKFTTYLYTCLRNHTINVGLKMVREAKRMQIIRYDDDNFIVDNYGVPYEDFVDLDIVLDSLTSEEKLIIDAFMKVSSQNKAADSIGMARTTYKRKLNKIFNKIKAEFGEELTNTYE